MILRRVIAHFRKQEWTAIFIDFLIVVVGVFVGLQVNNWNEARQDEATAQLYIARIQDDLLANQRDMEARIAFFTTIRTHMLGSLEALDDPPESLGRQFIIDSFVSTFTVRRGFGRDTYDELTSTGAGNTAIDVAIRQRLAQFYRATEGSEFFYLRVPPIHDTVRREMPYEAQSQLRQSGCNSTLEMDEKGEPGAIPPTDCRLTLSDEEAARIVAILLDADIGPDLTHALADIDLKLRLFQTTINRAQTLYDFLEESKK